MSKQTEPSKASPDFLKTDGGKSKSNAIDIPAISLPKGGGAIRGIDEKFSVNAVNGTASLSLPLPFSPARGASPALHLVYNSGAGNGVFGLGWMLNLPSIKRKTDKGLPWYLDDVDSDTFLFSEAEDLVPEFRKEADGSFSLDADGDYILKERDSEDGSFSIRFYKPRIEGSFARIERWSHKTSQEIKWRVITRENVTTLFGWSAASRISDPKNAHRIFAWLPEMVFDDKGNCCRYVYKREDAAGLEELRAHNRNRFEGGKITYTNLYLQKILYGNRIPYRFNDPYPSEADCFFETIFDYGEYDAGPLYDEVTDWDFRKDPFSDYRAGFEIRTTRLCRRVLLFHRFSELPGGSALVRSLNIEYESAAQEGFTFLKSLTSFGYVKKPDGTYSHKNLPAMEFEYQRHHWDKTVKTVGSDQLVHAPVGIDETDYHFTDLFNEGLAGILTEQGQGWFYKHNLGNGQFGQAQRISAKPSFCGLGTQWHLMDLAADGSKQLVSLNMEPKGYFELAEEEEWRIFQTFRDAPNLDIGDANTRMLDLDGDGKADILITEDHVFTWYESAGREGFKNVHRTEKACDEEKGPHVVFADPAQAIFLADMSGDGLTDIVRIRNGEVCYWPNLGYGRFGWKVTMDHAPLFDRPESFNPAHVHLADIDGSGTTDIIYIGQNKLTCWMNLNGNGFSTVPFEMEAFQEVHTGTRLTVIDLLGTGLACIVWSSALSKDAPSPMKYVDLMGGKKPHLMIGYKNNLGKEVSLEYTPSTKFYLDDKLAGKPWITRLHFPVHCISRTEMRDAVSGCRFVSSYRYHHGYYDHAEAEFRGFGMVEQIDAEHFEHWVKGNAANVVEQPLHQEPVVTRKWFHTGSFLGREKALERFAGEYWYEEMAREGFPVAACEVPLPDTRLTVAPGLNAAGVGRLSAEEWREAFRACKGMPLRAEVFALDAPLTGATEAQRRRQLTPYAVAAHNHTIELLQPKGRNRHAIFLVKESEALTYHYERNPEDPRISHHLNIAFDEHGNVLEAASVAYPRIMADASLPIEAQEAQNRVLISYVRNAFTNDVDTADEYRLRVLSETKTYELKGMAKSSGIYQLSDFANVLDTAAEAGYYQIELEPAPGSSLKRLVEHTRGTFYRNDLTGALPLHRLESRALPFENYQLAYTPALVADIFGARLTAPVLLEGKFTHSEGDDNWWVPSGTIRFLAGTETESDARSRFYSPISYIDPFGALTKVKYYKDYFLFIEETEDALGNRSRVETFNLRTLSPQRLRDPNANISEVLFDELGLVKAVALRGKGDEADDLTGLNEFSTPAEDALVRDFFGAPASDVLTARGKDLLQHSTARFVYDFDAYLTCGGPAVAASILREEHFQKNNDAPIQLSFEYSDGLGRLVMKKAQAEPGLARQVTIGPDDSVGVSEIDTSALAPKQLRWIGTGRTVLNNKGNAVKQYQPYFSLTHRYEDFKELVETGVTPLMYYDAVGRLMKTEMPDGTFAKTEFDAWRESLFDPNDTVLESSWYHNRTNRLIDAELTAAGKDPGKEKLAADKAARHAGTPGMRHFDTLGRAALSVEHNKNVITDADELYPTGASLDIEGNLRSVTNARGDTAVEYKYDMLGSKVYQNSLDDGKRWLLSNVLGNPLRTWDERGFELRYSYDILHRPTCSRVLGGDGDAPLDNLFARIIYGEGEPDSELKNLRGQPVRQYDTGGVIETPAYDFKGHPLSTTRRLLKDYRTVANWSDANLAADLELDSYTFLTETDAFGRIVRQTIPDGSVITFTYNEAGMLNGESVCHADPAITTTYIENIDYNERGQRERIVYGNGVFTRFSYDRETFRLKRLQTRRKNNDPLQDLHYTYDPVGNIVFLEDACVPVVFFNNEKITGLSSYGYDALYRLVEATGRENNAPLSFDAQDNWRDAPFRHAVNQGDPLAMRSYTRRYQYDALGNILQVGHQASGNHWTRQYTYHPTNNRLAGTQVGTTAYGYTHHARHGFITAMPHLEEMGWSFKEQVTKTVRQKRVDGGTSETTYYQYDGAGRRIRKVTENQADAGAVPTRKEERIYLGAYELYKKHSGTHAGLQRVGLSLMDEEHRFALIETRNAVDDDTEKHLVRYQLHDHIGSVALELDGSEEARAISYEEYYPFGETAYQARNASVKAEAKRYRYSGMERDEESGLAYHGARYYMPWLGRWASADPLGIADGLNPYAAFRSNPVRFCDDNGCCSVPYNFVRYAGSVEQGLDEIARLGTRHGVEFGLARCQHTGRLMILRGGRHSVAFLEATPLAHTHTGTDTTSGPSTDDLNQLAARQVREHWIYGRDTGWARLRYDPSSRSFEYLRTRGTAVIRSTISENPNFDPTNTSPMGQAARWSRGPESVVSPRPGSGPALPARLTPGARPATPRPAVPGRPAPPARPTPPARPSPAPRPAAPRPAPPPRPATPAGPAMTVRPTAPPRATPESPGGGLAVAVQFGVTAYFVFRAGRAESRQERHEAQRAAVMSMAGPAGMAAPLLMELAPYAEPVVDPVARHMAERAVESGADAPPRDPAGEGIWWLQRLGMPTTWSMGIFP